MTDELLERFFNKQCTAVEAAEVSQYLKDNPLALEKYLDSKEWFQAGSQPMPAAFWNDSWSEIRSRRTRVRRIAWIKKAAAAAVILISAGLAYNSFYIKQKPVVVASVEKQVAIPTRKITVNNSAQRMNISMPDSSSVILSPGSLITYNVPFAQNKREITLDGEARFSVAKNERKPFTVFAGGLATTALGTEFTINTKNNVSVKLHKGKVMITTTGDLVKHWKKDVILKPGQQLSYDSRQMTAAVGPIKTGNSIAKNAIVKKIKKPDAEMTALNFVNTSLPEVMTKLTAYYHERISFNSAELDEMNFTGTVSGNDSLKIVLKVISQMNNLELSHDDNGYVIGKTEK